ncbi:MAG: hypothetical protein HY293_03680 [Planctomycetes bacterium]|nr:hypothetical protein [Planctomycetota bacterium]
MPLRRTVLSSAAAWIVLIAALHAALNLDLFRKTDQKERIFKVGFLPVT